MAEERPNPAKGAYQIEMPEELLAEAEQAVRAHTRGEEPVRIEVASGDEDGGEELEVPIGGASLEELEALREELRERDLMLEESARRGRETMEHLKEANERMLRSAADLENYKKRAQKELEETRKFGIEKLLRDLLSVLDNFDRALEHAQKSRDIESFATGVQMTRKHFEDTLGRFGVKGFSAKGTPFDPHRHEAVQQVESHEHPAQVVVQELSRGYLLHDRLVRPAMVVVSRGPGPGAAASGAAAEGGAAVTDSGGRE